MTLKAKTTVAEMLQDLDQIQARVSGQLRNHYSGENVRALDLKASAQDMCAAIEAEQIAAGGFMAATLSANGMSAQLKKVMRLLPSGATVDESGMDELLDAAGIRDTVERLGCKIEAVSLGLMRK